MALGCIHVWSNQAAFEENILETVHSAGGRILGSRPQSRPSCPAKRRRSFFPRGSILGRLARANSKGPRRDHQFLRATPAKFSRILVAIYLYSSSPLSEWKTMIFGPISMLFVWPFFR